MAERSAPLVSVVMPAYNCEAFLETAIESIRRQTLTDWELLIVIDKSADRTEDISRSFEKADVRIRVIENRFGRGIAAALNTGLLAARGRYIARMDGDDISLPDRFALQVKYLEKHKHVGVVGMHYVLFKADGTKTQVRHSDNPLFNCFHLTANSILGHPTVMMRPEAVLMAGGYFEPEAAEDLGLWTRISRRWQVTNLKAIGLEYRVHSGNLSIATQDKVADSCIQIGSAHYALIMGTTRWHELVRALVLDPRILRPQRRLVGAVAAIVFCLRAARSYRVSVVSRTFLDSLAKIFRLTLGRPYHG